MGCCSGQSARCCAVSLWTVSGTAYWARCCTVFFPGRCLQRLHNCWDQETGENGMTKQLFSFEFFSVTFGAGGSTQDRTIETIRQIKAEGYNAAPHLSCVASRRENIRAMLDAYRDMGIRRSVALRGDLPSGMGSF